MKILISNDDGIYSPGLRALAQMASQRGDVRIVAPDVEQSSMALAVTATRPLRYRRTHVGDFEAYRVNGTPADCVALGSHLWPDVDVVLSGINIGLNLGNGMWHSGTLAAARQGILMGRRAIAFSAPADFEALDYSPLASHVLAALDEVLAHPELRLVNVNLPAKPRGVRWTRQSVRQYDGRLFPTKDPLGREHYWFTAVPLQETEEGTDRWALEHGYVSLTPLVLDLTDHGLLERARAAPLHAENAAPMT